jgi:hypothetical protein
VAVGVKDGRWVPDHPQGAAPYVTCWSCHQHLATAKETGWVLGFGYRTRGRRHRNGLPWYGWSERGIRRVHGRNKPDKSARGAWDDQRFQVPAVVTCKCGADNLLTGPQHAVR